jgi:hypothetical protein
VKLSIERDNIDPLKLKGALSGNKENSTLTLIVLLHPEFWSESKTKINRIICQSFEESKDGSFSIILKECYFQKFAEIQTQ